MSGVVMSGDVTSGVVMSSGCNVRGCKVWVVTSGDIRSGVVMSLNRLFDISDGLEVTKKAFQSKFSEFLDLIHLHY